MTTKTWIRLGNFIIELISPSTAKEDRTTKKTIYEKTFRTPEYFLYDPDAEKLEGWRLEKRVYQQILPDERGWLWSEELQLWLGTWTGEYLRQEAAWLRFYDAQGQLVLLGSERAAQRAESERRRATAAEAELALLKAQLAEQGIDLSQ